MNPEPTTLSVYLLLAPEIVIALGAMAILVVGTFAAGARNAQDRASRLDETLNWAAVGVLAVAAYLVVAVAPSEPRALFAGSFVSDPFTRFMKLLILLGAGVTLIMSFDYMRGTRLMRAEFGVLALFAVLGMMMMASAGGLIALYLGLELQSLALYVMAAYRRGAVRSGEAGLKYFVLGALSSGMLLYGASLIYGFTGSVLFDDIARAIGNATASAGGGAVTGPGAGVSIGLIFGLVFLLAGIAFKISAVPFHMWTPDVYEGAPTPVTAFFAAAPKVAAMALLVRLVLGAFPAIATEWRQILVFLSIASMAWGAFAAIGQSNIKRLMAYSSIGHMGFALVGLAAGSAEGVRGVLIYMAIYVVMTLGAFACILAMRRGDEQFEEISELAGLAQRNLPLAFVLAMLLFSLAGIPPLAGFFAKFYVFLAAIEAGLYPLAILGVLASVVGAYYYVRIVKVMFFDQPADAFDRLGVRLGLILGASGAVVLGFVLYPTPLIDAASQAARTFF